MLRADTVEPWLPDFCRGRRLGVMLGLAELVAVLLALVPDAGRQTTFASFVSTSAFALWVAIAVSAMLCLSRAWLSRFPVRLGGVMALVITGMIAFFAADAVYVINAAAGQAPLGVGFWRFVLGSAAVAVLITALALRYFYISDRWLAQINANARAEADALQARIRPHFLFNSMNLIATLVRRDPAVAEQAVLDLSDLFRAALGVGAGEGRSTLREEVDLARRYLSIESLRLGDRLRVDWQMQEPLPWSLPMPSLVLQPLVENAVLHGISRLSEGGRVTLDFRVDAGRLCIRIDNPAPDPALQASSLSVLHSGAGHAQRSIAWRLTYAFGPAARLQGDWQAGRYRCEIVLPLQSQAGTTQL